jgi:ParB family chromosome partitioning protein
MAELARAAVAEGLSVREVERRARVTAGDGAERAERKPRIDARPPAVRHMEDELRRRLQTDVHLTVSGGERGAISIQFYSADDLERIVDIVLGDGRERY